MKRFCVYLMVFLCLRCRAAVETVLLTWKLSKVLNIKMEDRSYEKIDYRKAIRRGACIV